MGKPPELPVVSSQIFPVPKLNLRAWFSRAQAKACGYNLWKNMRPGATLQGRGQAFGLGDQHPPPAPG